MWKKQKNKFPKWSKVDKNSEFWIFNKISTKNKKNACRNATNIKTNKSFSFPFFQKVLLSVSKK